ncbi:hypothetical protein CEXT_235421 [Caerostris extrusa]|uniref:Uncharacterized protein n=1 Tax=Caerostris extrusa TaxID=172846 RepID=A0AAV4MXU8_CAEEX|nr:hypothetical protein CEXT_235421 [Caerostris extrusa]
MATGFLSQYPESPLWFGNKVFQYGFKFEKHEKVWMWLGPENTMKGAQWECDALLDNCEKEGEEPSSKHFQQSSVFIHQIFKMSSSKQHTIIKFCILQEKQLTEITFQMLKKTYGKDAREKTSDSERGIAFPLTVAQASH